MNEIQKVFVRRGLKVGDRLPPERELAKQLSVGRSSLREAIQGLQTMGFVETRHGIGTFFTSEPGTWSLAPLKFHGRAPRRLFGELVEARLLVEVRLTALAAEHATADDLERLRETAEKRARAGRGEYTELGLNFHLAVAAAAHHAVLLAMLQAVSDLYSDTLNSLDSAAQDVMAAFLTHQQSGHEQILRAIESRDPQAAAAAMRAHLMDLQSEFSSITEPSPTAHRERVVS